MKKRKNFVLYCKTKQGKVKKVSLPQVHKKEVINTIKVLDLLVSNHTKLYSNPELDLKLDNYTEEYYRIFSLASTQLLTLRCSLWSGK